MSVAMDWYLRALWETTNNDSISIYLSIYIHKLSNQFVTQIAWKLCIRLCMISTNNAHTSIKSNLRHTQILPLKSHKKDCCVRALPDTVIDQKRYWRAQQETSNGKRSDARVMQGMREITVIQMSSPIKNLSWELCKACEKLLSFIRSLQSTICRDNFARNARLSSQLLRKGQTQPRSAPKEIKNLLERSRVTGIRSKTALICSGQINPPGTTRSVLKFRGARDSMILELNCRSTPHFGQSLQTKREF